MLHAICGLIGIDKYTGNEDSEKKEFMVDLTQQRSYLNIFTTGMVHPLKK